MTTPQLLAPELAASQSQPEVIVNEAIRILEAAIQLSVLDKDLNTPPASPVATARYIVGAAPTGAWVGHTNQVAYLNNSSWRFLTPAEGWFVHVDDENTFYKYSGAAWEAFSGGGGATLTIANDADSPADEVSGVTLLRFANAVLFDLGGGEALVSIAGAGSSGTSGGSGVAADVSFTNTLSGLRATDVQDAIDELVNPRRLYRELSDLMGPNGADGISSAASSGGSVTYSGSSGHPGVAEITTASSTATSNGILRDSAPLTGRAPLLVGTGKLTFEALVRLDSTWPASNTGQIRVGFMDEISGAPSNGIHAQYDETVSTWRFFARAAGVSSSINGGTTVTTGWHRIRVEVNAAGTSCELFVDGVSQGSLSANIPTAGFSYGVQIQKTAGTTAMTCGVDYMDVRQHFTADR